MRSFALSDSICLRNLASSVAKKAKHSLSSNGISCLKLVTFILKADSPNTSSTVISPPLSSALNKPSISYYKIYGNHRDRSDKSPHYQKRVTLRPKFPVSRLPL